MRSGRRDAAAPSRLALRDLGEQVERRKQHAVLRLRIAFRSRFATTAAKIESPRSAAISLSSWTAARSATGRKTDPRGAKTQRSARAMVGRQSSRKDASSDSSAVTHMRTAGTCWPC
jgi:hypothetical protein